MNVCTCIGCGVGLADVLGEPRQPVKIFDFKIQVCVACRNIASQRREDIVAAIQGVLRS